MAEREGFEPSVPILSEHTISSRAPSASRASLRLIIISNSKLLRSVYRLRRERGMCSLTKFAPPPPRSFGGSPNPRSRFCRNTRFPVVPLRPLGHLSVLFLYAHSAKRFLLVVRGSHQTLRSSFIGALNHVRFRVSHEPYVVRGGGSRIRTHGAFTQRFSRPPP